MVALIEKADPVLEQRATISRYDITITPNFGRGSENRRFLGTVEQTWQTEVPMTELQMHGKGLTVHGGRIRAGGLDFALDPIAVRYNPKDERMTLEFGKELPPGEIRVELEYTGERGKSLGLYPSPVLGADGKPDLVAVTQFEAQHFREMAPGIDDPGVRSVFGVNVVVPEGYEAFGNMLMRERETREGRTTYRFDDTDPLPAYLVSLLAGKGFDRIDETRGGTLHRVITAPGKRESAREILEISEHATAYFGQRFGVPFPLPHIQHGTVTNFVFGAMENHGLIIYKEGYVLMDPTTPLMTRQVAEMIVHHEVSHHWFGNLVTPKSFRYTFLNESFANWMGFEGADARKPELRTTDFLFFGRMHKDAMDLDALVNSHAADPKTSDRKVIEQLFDAITYSKGNAEFICLADWLGKDIFDRGVGMYLEENRYGHGTPEKLWDALGRASGKNVREIGEDMVGKVGFPVLDARIGRDGKLVLTQRRFMYADAKDKTLYRLPVKIAQGGRVQRKIIRGKKVEFEVEGENPVVVNPGKVGFLRVNYSPEMLKDLEGMVQRQELDPRDRWAIHDDRAALTFAREVKLDDYLAFVERAYGRERDPLVVGDVSQWLGKMGNRVAGTEAGESIDRVVVKLQRAIFKEVGWKAKKGEAETESALRAGSIMALGRRGESSIMDRVNQMYRSLLNGKKVDNNLRATVYALAAWHGDEATADELIAQFRKTESEADKAILLGAMGQLRDRKAHEKALRFILEEKNADGEKAVGVTYYFNMTRGLAANPVAREWMGRWTLDNWKKLKEQFKGGDESTWKHILEMLGKTADRESIEKIAERIKEDEIEKVDELLKQTRDRIEANLQFTEAYAR